MRQVPPRMSRARTNRPDIEMSRSTGFNDAIDPRDNFKSVKKSSRPEMKGPSDLDDILSGLKTKKLILKSQKDKDSASVVSISELNDMKDSSLKNPKKSRRKPKSERNTISLNFN